MSNSALHKTIHIFYTVQHSACPTVHCTKPYTYFILSNTVHVQLCTAQNHTHILYCPKQRMSNSALHKTIHIFDTDRQSACPTVHCTKPYTYLTLRIPSTTMHHRCAFLTMDMFNIILHTCTTTEHAPCCNVTYLTLHVHNAHTDCNTVLCVIPTLYIL